MCNRSLQAIDRLQATVFVNHAVLELDLVRTTKVAYETDS